ncbi:MULTISPECIES: response regulator transcription factor [unclassified Aureimonas]|uniref:response regulator transcription factor n=1 Tax=unclassified Aureimonas TaxID=2615206 RepID=UPI0006F1CDD3|nr:MULTISPECIES: response regulator [unclassified Aureimonas]KQT55184.1 hypothetical protein ASG62_10090 [Aureimonas sp. Leaf427]KQT70974.1 hypothetical protein ASG54_20475 [Aureimonas sp. Leaf460]
MANEATVHVIDDDDAVLRSLAFLLRAHRIPVATYAGGREFLDTGLNASGCILSDVRMPGMDGIELLRALRAQGSSLPFLVMTGHADVAMAVEAMKSGAIDFIEKPFGDDGILAMVRRGLQLNEAQQAKGERVRDARERLALLSLREKEVLVAVAEGKASKAIAHELGLSVRTVEVHRSNLMTKLKVENAASAIALLRKAEG